MTTVHNEEGTKMQFNLREAGIRDANDILRVVTTVQRLSAVQTAHANGHEFLHVELNFGRLQGQNRDKALSRLHDQIKQIIAHKRDELKKAKQTEHELVASNT